MIRLGKMIVDGTVLLDKEYVRKSFTYVSFISSIFPVTGSNVGTCSISNTRLGISTL